MSRTTPVPLDVTQEDIAFFDQYSALAGISKIALARGIWRLVDDLPPAEGQTARGRC